MGKKYVSCSCASGLLNSFAPFAHNNIITLYNNYNFVCRYLINMLFKSLITCCRKYCSKILGFLVTNQLAVNMFHCLYMVQKCDVTIFFHFITDCAVWRRILSRPERAQSVPPNPGRHEQPGGRGSGTTNYYCFLGVIHKNWNFGFSLYSGYLNICCTFIIGCPKLHA